MYLLFVKYVYDSMVESDVEVVWSYFVLIKNYLNMRVM